MGWARIDDGFHDHPKTGGLSLAAVGLWTFCLTWANRHLGADNLPPGFIPTHQPRKFGASPKLIAELVTAVLWEPVTGGWLIHDFEEYLPAARKPATSSEVTAARSAAGSKGAKARWQSDSKPDSNLPREPMASTDGKPMPPSRPVPSPNQNQFAEPRSEPDRPLRAIGNQNQNQNQPESA
jgi:hypothetical protein